MPYVVSRCQVVRYPARRQLARQAKARWKCKSRWTGAPAARAGPSAPQSTPDHLWPVAATEKFGAGRSFTARIKAQTQPYLTKKSEHDWNLNVKTYLTCWSLVNMSHTSVSESEAELTLATLNALHRHRRLIFCFPPPWLRLYLKWPILSFGDLCYQVQMWIPSHNHFHLYKPPHFLPSRWPAQTQSIALSQRVFPPILGLSARPPTSFSPSVEGALIFILHTLVRRTRILKCVPTQQQFWGPFLT